MEYYEPRLVKYHPNGAVKYNIPFPLEEKAAWSFELASNGDTYAMALVDGIFTLVKLDDAGTEQWRKSILGAASVGGIWR